jgi:hypothetical protein
MCQKKSRAVSEILDRIGDKVERVGRRHAWKWTKAIQ